MWIKRSSVVVFAAACALMMSGCHGLFGAFLTGLTGQVPPGFDDDHEEDSCAELGLCNLDVPIPKVGIVIPSNYVPEVGEQITLSAISTPPANGPIAWDTNGDGQVGAAGDAAAGNPVTASFPAPGVFTVTASTPTSQGPVVGTAPITVLEGELPPGCTQLSIDLTQSPTPVDPPPPPNTVNFTVSQATEAGAPVAATYAWDFETDGTIDVTTTEPGSMSHTYPGPGTYTATVVATATNGSGDCGSDSLTVTTPAGSGSRDGTASVADSGAEPQRAQAPKFTVRLTGASLDAGRLSTSGERIALRRAIGLGKFRLRISGSPATVRTGTAISGASLTIDRDNGKRALRGVVLAQLDGIAGATCLTFRLKAPGDEPLRGRVRILGGPAGAGGLSGRGRVSGGKAKGKGPAKSLRVRGTVRTHASEPVEVPARCARLVARAL